jgi:hypothetical protein
VAQCEFLCRPTQLTMSETCYLHHFTDSQCSATFIPAVRTIFRRPRDERDSANDTEYAFRRSKSLISRILDSAYRPGFATLAFFVFAVMYVFQNEVTLRVARTVAKRLKKLSSKVERGEDDISEDDLKLLQGWRWNVLLWS